MRSDGQVVSYYAEIPSILIFRIFLAWELNSHNYFVYHGFEILI